MPHLDLEEGQLAVPGATLSSEGGGWVVGLFLEALHIGFVMLPALLLFTQLLHLHLCAKCQSSGPLCLLGWGLLYPGGKTWKPSPGPGSCSVRGCRELANRLWILCPSLPAPNGYRHNGKSSHHSNPVIAGSPWARLGAQSHTCII